jgi:HlyD family secretion protein
MKRFLGLGLVLVAGLGAYALSRSSRVPAEPSARYRTEVAARGAMIASVAATGTVTPTTTVIVGSQLSGQVVEINVDHNSLVTAGQVLARLNNETLLAKRGGARADLAQAVAARKLNDAQAEKVQADLLKVQAQKRDIEAQFERAKTLFTDAETTFSRQQSLKAKGYASGVAFQNAATQRDSLRSAMASAEAQIASSLAQIAGLVADAKVVEAQKASGDAQIARAEAQVRQIEVDLANSTIRSPVDGVVIQRNVELGQTVAASLQAPTLFLVAQDLRRIEIYVNLDESDVGRVKPGQGVEFNVNAYGSRTFTGKVKLVRLGSQNVQNVVIYTTIVEVENEDMALLPGMTANLRIFTERKPDVLRVINAALRWQPAGTPRLEPSRAAMPDAPADAAGPFGAPAGAGGNSARSLAVQVESLRAELSLTPDQVNRVEGLAKAMREAIGAAGQNPEARREIARAERQKFQRALEAVLNAEQQEKYRTQRAEQRATRQGLDGGMRGVPGRVYILDAKGQPQALSLRLGASDGTFSEVISGDLKVGDLMVTGLNTSAPKGARPPSSVRFGF